MSFFFISPVSFSNNQKKVSKYVSLPNELVFVYETVSSILETGFPLRKGSRSSSKHSISKKSISTRKKLQGRTRVQLTDDQQHARNLALARIRKPEHLKYLVQCSKPAHMTQNLSEEVVQILLNVSLKYIEDFIVFRMQSMFSTDVTPKNQLYVTTMPLQVWNAFVEHCTKQSPPKVSRRTHSIYDHGQYHKFKNTTISYFENTAIPTLATENWFLKRYNDTKLACHVKASLTSVAFTYDEFSQKVRVDMEYFCHRLEPIFADELAWILV